MILTHIVHTFEPVYNSDSRILILGSLPSVKSRENGFYYGNLHNRFWKVLSAVLSDSADKSSVYVPQSIEEKKNFLLRNRIALWDVVHDCDISGSSDSSIRNVTPNNLQIVFDNADINNVFANGTAAFNLYSRYCSDFYGRTAQKLPSTSPANASWNFDMLVSEWRRIRDFL